MFQTLRITTIAAVLALASIGVDAQTPPTEHKGLSVSGKAELPVGKQIPALAGYKLRVRTVVMAPGGVVKNHDHKTRPGAFYVVSGDNIVEYRGAKSTVIKPGQVVLEDFDTDHWVENKGGEATLFVVDLVPVK